MKSIEINHYSPIHIHSPQKGSHGAMAHPRIAHGQPTWFMLCANGTGAAKRGPALRRWSSSIKRPWTWSTMGFWHGHLVGNGKFPWENCRNSMGCSWGIPWDVHGKFHRMFMGNSIGCSWEIPWDVHVESHRTMELSWEISWDFSIPKGGFLNDSQVISSNPPMVLADWNSVLSK